MTFLLLLPLLTVLPDRALGGAQADESHDSFTVRELMRLESEAALQALRRGRTPGAPGPRGPLAPAPQAGEEALRLVGIYGVGKRLFAEVRAGSQGWVFLRGQPLPLGHTASSTALRLRELSGACVRLVRQEEDIHLCLPRGGRSG
ncbi:MAG TPA: hypothetical protein VKZ52_01340 [Burkholderiaceae bacterium]|nr:hypothetical protein [Burkholderiaceae bacterium]